MNPFDAFKSAADMSEQVRLGSILNSLLWVLPALILGLVIVSFTQNTLVQTFLMWAIGIDIFFILAVFAFVLLLGVFKNPALLNLLRSEDYSLKMKYLETLGDQTHSYKEVETSVVENNPELPNPSSAPVPTPKQIEAEKI